MVCVVLVMSFESIDSDLSWSSARVYWMWLMRCELSRDTGGVYIKTKACCVCLSFGNSEIESELFVQASHCLCQSLSPGRIQYLRGMRVHAGSYVVCIV